MERSTRLRIASATRLASDEGRPLRIASIAEVPHLIAGTPQWSSPFELLNRLLLLMESRVVSFTDHVLLSPEVDFPLIGAQGPGQFLELVEYSQRLGLFDQAQGCISIEGWKRLDQLRTISTDSRQAFVAMWFNESLNDVWRRGFREGIERSGYFRAVRVDGIQHNEKIDDRIIAEIRRSALLVSDFTGQRGGVYFEAGVGLGLGLPLIWSCRYDEVNKLHFDTRQYNYIVWRTPEDLADRLHDRICATVLPGSYAARMALARGV